MQDNVSPELLDEFVAACHRVDQYGLIRCSSGNMSARIDAERMLLTATRSWLGTLTREQVAICRIADGTPLAEARPSVEAGFHAGILRKRPDVRVVLHFQTPAATTLACRAGEPPNYFVIPEIPYYIGHIATVPFCMPGSAPLSEAVVAAMLHSDLAVLRNHGQVVVGRDFADALQRAVFFELACRVILDAGDRLQPLGKSEAAHLLTLRAESQAKAV